MAEIYWMYVIGNVSDLFLIILIISSFCLVAGILSYCGTIEYDDEDKGKQFAKKLLHRSFIVIAISTIGILFTPSQKQLYAIYGIGGTIDYLKNNDKAKQLPDKCIDALTRYIDSIEKKEKKKEDKE